MRDWADLASFVREVSGHGKLFGSPTRLDVEEARRILAERRKEWNATLQDYQLNGDRPDSPAGQALVARSRDTIERFTATAS